MRRLLKTVLRFDDTTYKLGRTGLSSLQTDLAGLADCTRRLIYEIDVEAVATGLEVHVEVMLAEMMRVGCRSSSSSFEIATITIMKKASADLKDVPLAHALVRQAPEKPCAASDTSLLARRSL